MQFSYSFWEFQWFFFVDTTIEFQICLIHAMNRRKAVHIYVRRRFFFISEIDYKRKNSSNF